LDTVLVRGFAFETTQEEVSEWINSQGFKPVEVRVLQKKARRFRRKGEVIQAPARAIAFIKFDNSDLQKEAIDKLHKTQYKDQELNVQHLLIISYIREP
jgi:RNA recognition motif-containing protein